MQSPDKETIGLRMEWLERELRFKSRRAFALSIDADPAFFDKIVKGRAKLPDRYAENLEQKHGVNKEWLQNGLGEPFQKKDQSESLEDVLRRVDSNLGRLLKGQGDILDQGAISRAELRGVAKYLVLQDSKEDMKAMEGLWEIYRRLVGASISASDQKDNNVVAGR